jgi:hypothetical protein
LCYVTEQELSIDRTPHTSLATTGRQNPGFGLRTTMLGFAFLRARTGANQAFPYPNIVARYASELCMDGYSWNTSLSRRSNVHAWLRPESALSQTSGRGYVFRHLRWFYGDQSRQANKSGFGRLALSGRSTCEVVLRSSFSLKRRTP